MKDKYYNVVNEFKLKKKTKETLKRQIDLFYRRACGRYERTGCAIWHETNNDGAQRKRKCFVGGGVFEQDAT